MRGFEDIKPSIIICCENPEKVSTELKLIQQGLEEEGVPAEIKTSNDDVESLAISAARESRLGIGIGISSDGKCLLQHKRMPPGNPVMKIFPGLQDGKDYRLIGCNAARLAKIMPLKLY
ncbi:MAG: glycerol dehydratase reactivase beta/small subunit family protein [Tepidanaerobacteraceae bacterium]|jgi:hypothetical protein|nr:glycerol dehydratase reactivase beta/small subunit family protein [Tepidanaerobacteraceae bacterium]